MKYRKKPIIVDAFKWTGGLDQEECPVWADDAIRSETIKFKSAGTPNASIIILGMWGKKFIGGPGDYVILNPHGDLTLCDPGEFEATYELVEGQ